MKVLQNTIIVLTIIIVIALLIPGDLRAGYWFYLYGKTLETTGDTGGASISYKNATEAMPDNVKFVRAYTRSLNDIGEMREEESYFETAEDIADNWIDLHESHDQVYQIYIELARAQWGRGRKTNAKASINRAVVLMPTSYDALVYQGIILRDIHPRNKESVRKSIPVFEQAIRVRNFTQTWWANYELAKAWWMIDDEGNALIQVNQALGQFPPRWLRDDAERLKHEIQSSGRSER